ncbi:MAG: hypothetical protein K2G46_05295, partial [Bacteroidales bacterium]|nr:hypothetical protein [Bacteroidales bacterium]
MAQSENTAADDPEDNSTPIYQSFFDGNPVYYQTWSPYWYKWDGGVTIKSHGLEGDTMIEGMQYHKMSVGGPSKWNNM